MKPTKPKRIEASKTKIGDILINKNRTVQVLEARAYPEIGAFKLVCRDANAPADVRPRVMWIGPHTALRRLMSNDEITVWQVAGIAATPKFRATLEQLKAAKGASRLGRALARLGF